MRVPGVFAANRQNYAQDLQISSRGFGARAAFGVRGVRLYQDDIPATMPDGQGQTGSFSLLSAQAHRGAARPVLDALRQRVGRRDLGVHRGRNAPRRCVTLNGERRQLRHVERRRQGDRHGGRRRLRRRRQRFRHRRLSRSLRRIARSRQREARASNADDATRRHVDRQYAVPAGDTGSARPDPRAVGRRIRGRPIRRRSCSTRARRSTRCRAALTVDQAFSDDWSAARDRLRRAARGSGSTWRSPGRRRRRRAASSTSIATTAASARG